MLRLLRWGTLLMLILGLAGVAMSYPLLRERFFGPMMAAPSLQGVATSQAATLEATSAVSATLSATSSPQMSPTLRPALPSAGTSAPAVIIAPASPTPTSPTPTARTGVAMTPTVQSNATPTPFAVATTSLLPVVSEVTATAPVSITPAVAVVAAEGATATVTVMVVTAITVSINDGTARPLSTPMPTAVMAPGAGIAIQITPATATPTVAAGEPPAFGEKGYEPPLGAPAGPAILPGSATPFTVTPIVVLPSSITPVLITTVEVTPSLGGPSEVTPVVVITMVVTPGLGTPAAVALLPSGPTANSDSPLYSGPDFNFAIVGQVTVGEPLTILGWYTEGTWYLLANGAWLPGAVVNNAPLTLPLVFPTATPIPSATPTSTPTPTPSATPLGTATPSATPTSLDAPVCDCSGDRYDCLGNVFASRADAQRCFEYCFRQRSFDVHLLDPNLNGQACENLPNTLPATPAATSCDPNYSGACVPLVSYDLNCADLAQKNFRRSGDDPHGLDSDNDTIACEEGE